MASFAGNDNNEGGAAVPVLQRQSSLDNAANAVGQEADLCLDVEDVVSKLDGGLEEDLVIVEHPQDVMPILHLKRTSSNSSHRTLVACPVCYDERASKMIYQCKNGFTICYQCLRASMCVDIQRDVAPQCKCGKCGDLPKLELPFSKLVNTLCPLCYKEDPEYRQDPTVKVGCALNHSFCPSCIRFDLLAALKKGKTMPKCPRYRECKYTLEQETMKRVLEETKSASVGQEEQTTEGYMRQWLDLRVRTSQADHPLGHPCSRPDCTGYVMTSTWESHDAKVAQKARCSKCEFLYCSECKQAHHPGAHSCTAARKASAQWTGFLQAIVEKEAGESGGAAEVDVSAVATAALVRIQQDGESDEWFRREFASQSDVHGLKFCPNPDCRKLIYKVDRCPSMTCGKNKEDDLANQDGCGRDFDWRKTPHATQEEIDAYLKKHGTKQFASVTLTTDHAQYNTGQRDPVFFSKDLRWKKISCTECTRDIHGTRFDCIQCGGDSGFPETTLCMACVTKHVDHHWGKTKHSGHQFAVVNPATKRPLPALKFLRSTLSESSGILSVANIGQAFDLVEMEEKAGEYRRRESIGDTGLVTVRVDVCPDGRVLFADSAGRAVGSLYLDSIMFRVNGDKKPTADEHASNMQLLNTTSFHSEGGFGTVHVETEHICVPEVLRSGARFRFDFSVGKGIKKYMVVARDRTNVEVRLANGEINQSKEAESAAAPLITDDLAALVKAGELTMEQAVAMCPPPPTPPKRRKKEEETKDVAAEAEYVAKASVWEVVSHEGGAFMLQNVLYPELFLRATDKADSSADFATVDVATLTQMSGDVDKRFHFTAKVILEDAVSEQISLFSSFYGKKCALHASNRAGADGQPSPYHFKCPCKGRHNDDKCHGKTGCGIGCTLPGHHWPDAWVEDTSRSPDPDFQAPGSKNTETIRIDTTGRCVAHALEPPTLGCSRSCTTSHHGKQCFVCNRGWGNHNGHSCHNGKRGSFPSNEKAARIHSGIIKKW